MRSSTIERLQNFAMASESPFAINSALSFETKLPQYVNIHQYVIYNRGDFFNRLILQAPRANLEVEEVNERSKSIRLARYGSRGQKISGVITVLPSGFSSINRIITISYSNFWQKVVMRLVKKVYPFGVPIFFKQDEIKDVLIGLEHQIDRENFRVRILEATLKGKRAGATPRSRKQYETDRVWTEQPVRDVFFDAFERNQWFTSLRFAIQKINKSRTSYNNVAVGRIYKHGQVSYNSWHDEISREILQPLERITSDRMLLFQHRGLKENNYIPKKPLEIQFDKPLFDEIEEVRRFGRVISSFKNATKSVYHGNPYYHASVADYIDGSSIEVWVLSPNNVLLIPQIKTTEQALERLVSHIYYEFREGIVGEYRDNSEN